MAGPLLTGLGWTAIVFFGGAVVATVCAFLAGLGRLSRDPILRGVSRTYVEVFRGGGLLLQLFWFAFVFRILIDLEIPNLLIAIVVTGLNVGAYGAEVVRGAVLAVPRGQLEASVALNLTKAQRMRHVVLPQALVAMLPPFGNLLIELLKSTALVSMIFITDLTRAAVFVRDHTGRVIPVFTAALLLYFLFSLAITFTIRRVERRVRRRWHSGDRL